jgi:hypothetical protein
MIDTPAFAEEVIQALRELFQDSRVRERVRGLADTRSFPIWTNCEVYYQLRSRFPEYTVVLDHRYPDSELGDVLIWKGDRRTGPVFRIEGDGAVCDSDDPGLVITLAAASKGMEEAEARLRRIEARLPACVQLPGVELVREDGKEGTGQFPCAIAIRAYPIR